MTHLTDDQLNEVLDNSILDTSTLRHLDTCTDCRTRLEDLRSVFTTLEAIPEVQPPRDLTASILSHLPASWGGMASRRTRTWTWLSAAQALGAFAILAWFASSFVLPPEIATYQLPTFDSLLASAIQMLSSFTFETPTFEFQTTAIDLQSTTILTFVISAVVLWLVGNGLLLRAPARRNHQ